MRQTLGIRVIVALSVATAGCTVHQSSTATLTGPSEAATSISVAATPDSINQDGGSQSSIVVTTRDASGAALVGCSVRVDMAVNGAQQDFGVLAARNLVTNSSGTAITVYTAPAAPPPGSTVKVNVVTIVASYIKSVQCPTASGAFATNIRLTPTGVIVPPADTPTAAFNISPTPVNANVPANFDASASCGGQITNGSCQSNNTISSYVWNFGDASSSVGRTVGHAFSTAGTYTVTLTVTNSGGASASTTQQVTVVTSGAPVASFFISPTSPAKFQPVLFSGDASHAAVGHSIVRWTWNFGDPYADQAPILPNPNVMSGANLISVQHTYPVPSGQTTYTAELTVLDDTGQTATFTVPITVRDQ